MSLSPDFQLETLGTLALRGTSVETSAADKRQQRRRLALLAVLAAAGERGRTRDQLLLLFWPDSTEKKARHSLDQLLYSIRSSLHEAIIAGVNPLRLNCEIIASDVGHFEKAVSDGDFQTAVSHYRGPFLDGFYLSETREFEDWLDAERRRLHDRYIDSLERLAACAEKTSDWSSALRWRQALAAAEPSSTRHAVALIRAHADAGEYTEAINFAERYERVASRELGMNGVPEVKRAVGEVRERMALADAAGGSAVTPRVSHVETASVAAPTVYPALPAQTRSFVRPFYIAASIVAVAAAGVIIFAQADSNRTQPSVPVGARVTQNVLPARYVTRNVAAYDLYKRGQDPVLMRNDSTALEGVRYFTEAIKLDPSFAAAHAALSNMYTRLSLSSRPLLPQSELRKRAESEALKAIAIDDSLADGHAALGLANAHWPSNLQVAERELKRAAAIDSTLPRVHEYLATVHVHLAQPNEALSDAHRAVSMDPLSPSARATLAGVLYSIGRCDQALPILDSLDAVKPPLLRVAITKAHCFASQQRWAEASSAVEKMSARGDIRAMGLMGMALARGGKREEAIALRSKLREMVKQNSAAHFDIATVSLGLGDMDDVHTELELAVRSGRIPYEVMGPVFSQLREDGRFATILALRGIQVGGRRVVFVARP